MPKKVEPVIAGLIYDALLKCYWRKEALKRFLRDSGIAGSFIAQLDMTESKRTWLGRLFPLFSDHEKGAEVLLAMGRTLASMKSFPDLEGWEDSAQKIQAAREAVRALSDAFGAEVVSTEGRKPMGVTCWGREVQSELRNLGCVRMRM